MSGVIVSVKGRYAVLLTKNSDFIKVKNKNYSVGDKVKIPQYKGQILAAATSFIVVCGGISSYFVPAKIYVQGGKTYIVSTDDGANAAGDEPTENAITLSSDDIADLQDREVLAVAETKDLTGAVRTVQATVILKFQGGCFISKPRVTDLTQTVTV